MYNPEIKFRLVWSANGRKMLQASIDDLHSDESTVFMSEWDANDYASSKGVGHRFKAMKEEMVRIYNECEGVPVGDVFSLSIYIEEEDE